MHLRQSAVTLPSQSLWTVCYGVTRYDVHFGLFVAVTLLALLVVVLVFLLFLLNDSANVECLLHPRNLLLSSC
jgi:hypothetical protein